MQVRYQENHILYSFGSYILHFYEMTHSLWAYLKSVCKEVVVEHRPVLATNVHDDFAQLVSDEIGHRLLLSEKQFGQTAANLHLVL